MKEIITIGIDLAKNVFAVHAVDALGQVVWAKPAVKRHQLLELSAVCRSSGIRRSDRRDKRYL